MKSIIIKQALYRGQDNKICRAYRAVKAFIKFTEIYRGANVWRAELQPK